MSLRATRQPHDMRTQPRYLILHYPSREQRSPLNYGDTDSSTVPLVDAERGVTITIPPTRFYNVSSIQDIVNLFMYQLHSGEELYLKYQFLHLKALRMQMLKDFPPDVDPRLSERRISKMQLVSWSASMLACLPVRKAGRCVSMEDTRPISKKRSCVKYTKPRFKKDSPKRSRHDRHNVSYGTPRPSQHHTITV